jgi:hypothetical protein
MTVIRMALHIGRNGIIMTNPIHSCIECNQLDSDEDFYETHQWLPDRLWCLNKPKGRK